MDSKTRKRPLQKMLGLMRLSHLPMALLVIEF